MNATIRPTLLTILCILTFVGSAFYIFNGISTYANPDTIALMTKDALDDTKDKIEDAAKDDKSADFMSKILDGIYNKMSIENIKNGAIVNIISGILTMLGAILMWGLDKRGFWLYVLGALISTIAPLFIFGGMLGTTNALTQAFMGLVFCLLYARNLKIMY